MDEGVTEASPENIQEGEKVDKVDVDWVTDGVSEEDYNQCYGQLCLVHVKFELGLKRGLVVRRAYGKNILKKGLGG